MSPATGELQQQAVRQHCKPLRLPAVGGQFARLAEAAAREGQSRAIARLLHEARLPRMKTLDEFDRSGVQAARLRELAEGGYIGRAEPVLLAGFVHQADVAEQRPVFDGALALGPRSLGVIARGRNPRHAAHDRHRPDAAVVLDEREPHRDGTAKMPMDFF